MQTTTAYGGVIRDYTYDAFGVELNPDGNDTNPFRYCGEQYDSETGNYYLRAWYYAPGTGRFTQEDTHWNPDNMVYGDDPKKWNEYQSWLDESDRDDPRGLHTCTYKPEATAVAQAGNLYAYCGGNPLLYRDIMGKEWYHWVIGGLIVGGVASGYGLYRNDRIRIAGKGSTGRVEARSLNEQLAMKQVMSDPLKGAKQLTKIPMNDPCWPASTGWAKMENIIRLSNQKINIHFVYNTRTGVFDDFKFK